MSKLSIRTPILVPLAALFFVQSSWADSVSGQFELDDTVIQPTEVAAFRVRDESHPREFKTYVMLTLQPVDRDAIAKDTDPFAAAINDDAVRNADYVSFHVDAEGTAGMNARIGGTQYIDSSGKIMGKNGALVASCTANSAQRIACAVKSEKPVTTMDNSRWSLDVSFDSVVLSRTPGKPLPKDGGDAGKVLLELVTAAEGDDLAMIVPLLSPAAAEDYQHDYNTPAQNLANAKESLDFRLPKQPKITGGELLDENTALLEVEGIPYEGSRALYIVTMQRTDGRWGYLDSQRVGRFK